MNFFDQDFGLSSSPTYPRRPPTAPPKAKQGFDQVSRKSGKKDDFDDLLDDLMSKQVQKKEKKKQREVIQPFSSTNLDPYPIQDFKKTQKWSTPNIDMHPSNHHQSPRFPNNSRFNSVMDERGSEDGRSYKSGITRQPQQQIDQLMTLRQPDQFKEEAPVLQRSSRNMMRPPLAKKQSKDQFVRQAKETSIVPDDASVKFSRGGAFESQTNIEFTPFIENRSRNNKESKVAVAEEKVRERVIEKEKIITVREEAVELKKQFENELREIKESYERQLKFANEKLREEIEESKKQKAKIITQYEAKIDEERNRVQRLNQQGISKMKELHEWQLKKRCEAYQIEIQKLKSISKLQDALSRQQSNYQVTQDNMENKVKERELGLERRKVEELKAHLDQRQKNLQFQQQNFQSYRKREEQRLQNDRRLLMQRQNELKKTQLQSKRDLALHKQQVANELANAELQLYRKREVLNLQREQVRMEKELSLKQKQQFESFNKDVFNDYKAKIKELSMQKQKYGQLQVELHKKIQTVQLNIDINRPSRPSIGKTRPVSSHQENRKNLVNMEIDNKINSTKQRFRDMEELARKLNVQTFEERQRMKQKVNVSAYITRLNRAITRH